MRTLILIGLSAFLAAGSPPGGGYSYVVLNHSSFYSLVRIGADGKYISTIANGFEGHSMTKDGGGDYIVAAVSELLRITRTGSVTPIARAPSGSQWIAVLQERDGAFIVTDNVQHALWRVSEDGHSMVTIAHYPIPNEHERDGTSLALDMQGNYMMLDYNHPVTRFFKITPAGAVTEVPLSKSFLGAGALLSDGPGNYLAKEGRGDAIIRIAATGEVTELVKFDPPWVNIPGMVRDPATGEIVALDNRNNRILRIGAGGRNITTFSSSPTYLRDPLAILVEPGEGQ